MDDADPKPMAENVTDEQVAYAQQPDRFTGHRGEYKGIGVYEFTDPSSGTTHRKVFARAEAVQTDEGMETFLTLLNGTVEGRADEREGPPT